MCARERKPPPPPESGLVQGLLAELRQLRVENARLNLEAEGASVARRAPDPNLVRAEMELRLARQEALRAQEQLARLEDDVSILVRRLRRVLGDES